MSLPCFHDRSRGRYAAFTGLRVTGVASSSGTGNVIASWRYDVMINVKNYWLSMSSRTLNIKIFYLILSHLISSYLILSYLISLILYYRILSYLILSGTPPVSNSDKCSIVLSANGYPQPPTQQSPTAKSVYWLAVVATTRHLYTRCVPLHL